MHISPLSYVQSEEIASLHKSAVSDTSSYLGKKYVTRLYQLLLSHPKQHISFGAFEKGHLIGVIIATTHIRNTQKAMHTLFTFRSLPTLFFRFLTGGITPKKVVKRLLFERKIQALLGNNTAAIVVLFVDPTHVRTGVGKALVHSVIVKFKKAQAKFVYVDVSSDNDEGLSFFEHIGFIKLFEYFGGTLLRYSLTQKKRTNQE